MLSHVAVSCAAFLFLSDLSCLSANRIAMCGSTYQHHKQSLQIIGNWIAHDSSNMVTTWNYDGTTSIHGQPLVVALSLTANGRATIQWGIDKQPVILTYRLLPKNILEFSSLNSKLKPVYHKFYRTKDRLEFEPYSASKNLEESIDLLDALTFIRK